MNEQTATTVSTLYALRAGLSAISMEYDAFNNECKRKYASIHDEWEEIYNKRLPIEQEARGIENDLKKTEGDLRDAKKWKHNTVPHIFLSPLVILLAIALFLAAIYCIFLLCIYWNAFPNWRSNGFLSSLYGWLPLTGVYSHDKHKGWLVPVGLIAILATGAGGILLSCYGAVWISSRRSAKQLYKRSKEEIERLKKRKAALAPKFQALPPRPETYDLDHLKKVCAMEGDDHLITGNLLYKELKRQFSFIDERDWQNIDYLIYCMETGRADSYKEALQMCDREKQTQRIEQSVLAAAEQISRSIARGFANLQAQMEVCFQSLSNEIRSAAGQIVSSIENASARTNARLTQISTSSALNNALLAKANENSTQLTNDVRRLREYADRHQ